MYVNICIRKVLIRHGRRYDRVLSDRAQRRKGRGAFRVLGRLCEKLSIAFTMNFSQARLIDVHSCEKSSLETFVKVASIIKRIALGTLGGCCPSDETTRGAAGILPWAPIFGGRQLRNLCREKI